MATKWLKSLQCNSKTTTIHDVITPSPLKQPLLPSSTCRYSFQSLNDVIHTHNPKPKPEPESEPRHALSLPYSLFQSVSELKVGHPSRNVVEMIFISRWGPKGFPGRVEMVFKIHNKTRVLTRFEEYRDFVRSKSGSGQNNARCSADGNEMMRFRWVGPTTFEKKGVVICTHGSSGVAHESGGGGGRGCRRGMLICRVIAGRVDKQIKFKKDDNKISYQFDSASRENGELVVFDHRAILPCFLVIYKL